MQDIIFVRGEQLFDCVIGCVSAGSSNEVASGNTHKERGTWWVVGTLDMLDLAKISLLRFSTAIPSLY